MPRCNQGWQHGAGVAVPVGPAAVERAECDAQHIGSIDGAAPERATQDIPPATVRFILRRDGGRCRVPGCRSARGLEVHHILHRAHGGTHEPANLVVLCGAATRRTTTAGSRFAAPRMRSMSPARARRPRAPTWTRPRRAPTWVRTRTARTRCTR